MQLQMTTEQAALDAVHQHRAETACRCLPQAEGLGENAAEHGREPGQIEQHDAHGQHKVAHRHDGHHYVQTFHGGVLAQNDDCGNGREHQRSGQRRNAEGVLKRGADRVGDDLTDAAPADQARHRKQCRAHRPSELFAPFTLGQDMEIVGRAAAPAAVERVGLAVLLGEGGLDERGGCAEKSGHPHPEHRARTAGGHSSHHAHQIAHAHPGGGGDDQGLERGKPAGAGLLLFAHGGDHIPEQAHRQQPGAEGEPDACREQQHHHKGDADAAGNGQGEQIAPQKAIDRFDKIYQQDRFLL